MPFDLENTIYVQANKPADVKAYVGDSSNFYFKNKQEIPNSHRYENMEVTEYINGVTKKYIWSGEDWVEIGTDLYQNSNLTTIGVGNLPLGQNLSGKSWNEIIDSIFFALTVSTFEISLGNNTSYTTDYEWGTLYNNATIRFKFTVSGIHLSTLTYSGDQKSKISITSGTTTYTLGICEWSITENAFVGTITNFTQSSSTTYNKSFTLSVNKSAGGVATKINTVYFNRNIYYGRHLANITSGQYNNNTLIGTGFLFTTRRNSSAVYSDYDIAATAEPQDIYLFIPQTYTVNTIVDADTQLNFPYVLTENITFTYNHVTGNPTTLYKIYKSVNKTAGAVTLKIT